MLAATLFRAHLRASQRRIVLLRCCWTDDGGGASELFSLREVGTTTRTHCFRALHPLFIGVSMAIFFRVTPRPLLLYSS